MPAPLKGLKGWLAAEIRSLARGENYYAVRINFPFCVMRSRYSRLPCTMTSSPPGPSSVSLEMRLGAVGAALPTGAGMDLAELILTIHKNDNYSR